MSVLASMPMAASAQYDPREAYKTSYKQQYKQPSPKPRSLSMSRSMARTMSQPALNTTVARRVLPRTGSKASLTPISQRKLNKALQRSMNKSRGRLQRSGSVASLERSQSFNYAPPAAPVTYATMYQQEQAALSASKMMRAQMMMNNPNLTESQVMRLDPNSLEDGVMRRYHEMKRLKPQLEAVDNNLQITDEMAGVYGIAPVRTREYCDDYFGTKQIPAHLPGRRDNDYRVKVLQDIYSAPPERPEQ